MILSVGAGDVSEISISFDETVGENIEAALGGPAPMPMVVEGSVGVERKGD